MSEATATPITQDRRLLPLIDAFNETPFEKIGQFISTGGARPSRDEIAREALQAATALASTTATLDPDAVERNPVAVIQVAGMARAMMNLVNELGVIEREGGRDE